MTRPYWHSALIAARIGTLLITLAASASFANERELQDEPPPERASDMKAPIERVFRVDAPKRPLFPRLRGPLESLPAFFSDTQLDIRFRTAYRRRDAEPILSEAWAMGGSVYYRSGWLADTFAAELEGFVSQPIIADADRDGTGLLAPGQQGYGALGIANGRLRHRGVELIGYRQYLDLPYVNRSDSRMTPNTFESLVLQKPEGELRFSGGYTWKIKRRTSNEFVSMTEALGLDVDNGLYHVGLVWDPNDGVHMGAVFGVIADVIQGSYLELGGVYAQGGEVEARLDTQFTYQAAIGRELLGPEVGDTWNVGARGSLSWQGLMMRLGFSVTGENAPIVALFGASPSYVDLMLRTFNRADEKAVLASFSYQFSRLGLQDLHFITNYAGGFGGVLNGERGDSHEVDFTVDYKITRGPLESFWLRVRAAHLSDELAPDKITDVRVILRYEFPVL